jgi:hypothetical protein
MVKFGIGIQESLEVSRFQIVPSGHASERALNPGDGFAPDRFPVQISGGTLPSNKNT